MQVPLLLCKPLNNYCVPLDALMAKEFLNVLTQIYILFEVVCLRRTFRYGAAVVGILYYYIFWYVTGGRSRFNNNCEWIINPEI